MAASDVPPVVLTVRERQVLALVAEGCTSKQIAGALGIALKTVNTHRENLAKKLGSSSIAVLTRYALANGITPQDVPFEGRRLPNGR